MGEPAEQSKNTMKRLTGEATMMLVAGIETTASALRVRSYRLLRNSDAVTKRLEPSFSLSVTTDPKHVPNWATLEKLRYF
ncbi:trichodiene oxygenase [Colletotrichum orchidophilum]|uniref:Trichodiene oxygenase n=1 Tax=Colletotrichum orchidophilum TaxID=1209926 RepID=A0A1G4ARY2_9PEZI|nr:trichodiene oxygenase [Colletotrichum orchidophilum]OHE91843.1 trichodiene oxygenase [Colletotrichum orchidophilum]